MGNGVQGSGRNQNAANRYGGSKKCGIILIHGYMHPFTPIERALLTKGMDISPDCVIKFPTAPMTIWFMMYMLPAQAVISPFPGEMKSGLDVALRSIESHIEDMIADGIPSENIVVHGYSQGAALTHYVAAHTKYKLGGFLPAMGWLPLRLIEPVYELRPVPVNVNPYPPRNWIFRYHCSELSLWHFNKRRYAESFYKLSS